MNVICLNTETIQNLSLHSYHNTDFKKSKLLSCDCDQFESNKYGNATILFVEFAQETMLRTIHVSRHGVAIWFNKRRFELNRFECYILTGRLKSTPQNKDILPKRKGKYNFNSREFQRRTTCKQMCVLLATNNLLLLLRMSMSSVRVRSIVTRSR